MCTYIHLGRNGDSFNFVPFRNFWPYSTDTRRKMSRLTKDRVTMLSWKRDTWRGRRFGHLVKGRRESWSVFVRIKYLKVKLTNIRFFVSHQHNLSIWPRGLWLKNDGRGNEKTWVSDLSGYQLKCHREIRLHVRYHLYYFPEGPFDSEKIIFPVSISTHRK